MFTLPVGNFATGKMSKWAQVGNDIIANGYNPQETAMAKLTSSRIAFKVQGRYLTAYDFDGANWTKAGSDGYFGNSNLIAMAGLTSSRVAHSDVINCTLVVYDFNGTTWAQVGNAFSMPSLSWSSMAGLTTTKIAFYDGTAGTLKAYNFNGTNWSQTGNSFTPAVANIWGDIAGLSSSRIAFTTRNGSAGVLETYDFNGTNWSKIGNTLNIGDIANPMITALTSTRIAHFETQQKKLKTYDFNGTDWTEVDSGITIPDASGYKPSMAAMSSTRVAFYCDVSDKIKTFEYSG